MAQQVSNDPTEDRHREAQGVTALYLIEDSIDRLDEIIETTRVLLASEDSSEALKRCLRPARGRYLQGARSWLVQAKGAAEIQYASVVGK